MRSMVLLLVLAVGCSDETRVRPQRIELERTATDDQRMRKVVDIEVKITVPRGVSIGEAMRPPVLLANSGSFVARKSRVAYGGRTHTIIEARFENVPELAVPERLFLGSYDVDFVRGLMTRRK